MLSPAKVQQGECNRGPPIGAVLRRKAEANRRDSHSPVAGRGATSTSTRVAHCAQRGLAASDRTDLVSLGRAIVSPETDRLQPAVHDVLMSAIGPGLVSVGYEGRTVEDLVEVMVAQNVQVVADVRLTPLSRKPGLSKMRLSAALAEAGVDGPF